MCLGILLPVYSIHHGQRREWIPQRVLGIELGSSGRAVSALNP